MTTSQEIKFQYYKANIKDSKPLGFVTLEQFFLAIQDPKPEIKAVFDQIRQAELDGNMELKASLKTSLFSFTPAVIVNEKRCYENITQFTGLMPLDFDHLSPEDAIELKNHVFNDFPYVIAAWLSASKCGVRALVNIPIVSYTDEYKMYFEGLQHHSAWLSASKCGVRALVNIPIVSSTDEYKMYFEGLQHHSDLGKYKNFDIAPKNAVLPLFLSHDPDILFGDCHEIWNKKYSPPKPQPKVQYKYDANPQRVYNIIEGAIDKIISNGHPQLRAASFALGGYVGAGYISFSEAENIITNLIDSNAYLSQKSSVYKKTAMSMIKSGTQKPLYL